jgi:hypothetical protein
MDRKLTLGLALGLLLSPTARAAADDLKRHVEFLASEQLEGRLSGSAGERTAAEYLVGELKRIGAVPLTGAQGFEFPFDFTAGTNDIGSKLMIDLPGAPLREAWAGTDQVRALSFSDNGTVEGPVVFAGYGLRIPDSEDLSYDSFFGLDVKDKIVVVLRYSPENVDDDRRAEMRRYSGLRYKALQARERGAKALLVVTGPNSPNAGKTIDAKFDAALSGSGLLAASISGEVAERIFSTVEGGLAKAQRALDDGNPHVSGFEIPDVTLSLEVKIERETRTGHNVIGYLPPRHDGRDVAEAQDFLILGAHYDHLGRGRHGNSLARGDEEGQVHCGADDNASGVAAVLDAGARLAGQATHAPIVLAFWSGEELGLLGSTEFVKNPPIPADEIAAYMNFDMVGRVRDNRLNLQGVGSSSVWKALIERSNVVVGFDVRTQSDPYLPTDASVFYRAGVPIVAFFTGSHEDYHRPTDRAATINLSDLERVAHFASILALKVGRLDEPPDYVKSEQRRESTGDTAGVRAYTGTIPDYATEVEGLRLSGVVGGGPADKAGLREGDVIVEFAGRLITNVYDYTYALDAIKVDEPVAVICLRDGERVEVTITPTARP